jgi:L-arabinose isomerase
MLRIIKVMTGNNKTSFMEDYTYHLEPNRERVLGAHMLEVCPTIAESKPTLEVHELGIGGKSAPARLIFSTAPSKAINCSLLDMGDEFKLLANVLETVKADQKMPKLPVASAVWIPQPNFKEGVKKWIENGGAHHSVYSQALNIETLEDFCRMADIEMTLI